MTISAVVIPPSAKDRLRFAIWAIETPGESLAGTVVSWYGVATIRYATNPTAAASGTQRTRGRSIQSASPTKMSGTR